VPVLCKTIKIPKKFPKIPAALPKATKLEVFALNKGFLLGIPKKQAATIGRKKFKIARACTQNQVAPDFDILFRAFLIKL
jgi:hypothetical protein